MPRIKLKSTNSKLSIIATFMIVMYGIVSFIIPSIIIFFIPQSAIGNYFIDYIFILLIIYLIISIYFILVGCYYYHIKIDEYVMYVTSYRTISGLLKPKNYIEVPHDLLKQYSFFKRSFSLNKTLMIKINDTNGKIIIKRFNLSFLSKNEEIRISKTLEQIIAKNR